VSVQDLVLAAYTNAFRHTRLLVRYPTVTGSHNPAALQIGYHDDSFAYSTLAPPGWHFLGLMERAGETNKWRTQPIGGEVRPEVQSCMWNSAMANCVPVGQEYSNCVARTHASWLLNHGLFTLGLDGEQRARALGAADAGGVFITVSDAKYWVTWPLPDFGYANVYATDNLDNKLGSSQWRVLPTSETGWRSVGGNKRLTVINQSTVDAAFGYTPVRCFFGLYHP